jgi:DNA repair exonuclease SbcCD ATPase subunit
MPTVKKAKAKPKAKPKVTAKPKAKKAVAAKKPAAGNKALSDLKAKIEALEAKLAKTETSEKTKQLDDKTEAQVQKIRQDMTTWEHKLDRKLDLLHDTVQGLAGKLEILKAQTEALELAVSSSSPTPPAPETMESNF